MGGSFKDVYDIIWVVVLRRGGETIWGGSFKLGSGTVLVGSVKAWGETSWVAVLSCGGEIIGVAFYRVRLFGSQF